MEEYAKRVGGVWGGAVFDDEKGRAERVPEGTRWFHQKKDLSLQHLKDFVCRLRADKQTMLTGYTWTGAKGQWNDVNFQDVLKSPLGLSEGPNGKLNFAKDDLSGVSFSMHLRKTWAYGKYSQTPLHLFVVSAPVDKTIFFQDQMMSSRDATVVREITDPVERNEMAKLLISELPYLVKKEFDVFNPVEDGKNGQSHTQAELSSCGVSSLKQKE